MQEIFPGSRYDNGLRGFLRALERRLQSGMPPGACYAIRNRPGQPKRADEAAYGPGACKWNSDQGRCEPHRNYATQASEAPALESPERTVSNRRTRLRI